MPADDFERAQALVRWKRHLDRAWPSVSVATTSVEEQAGEPGRLRRSTAQVLLGDLDPTDVEVQVIYGEVDLDDDLLRAHHRAPWSSSATATTPAGAATASTSSSPKAGNFGFTVRIVPRHDDVESYVQIGHVAWAPHPGGIG